MVLTVQTHVLVILIRQRDYHCSQFAILKTFTLFAFFPFRHRAFLGPLCDGFTWGWYSRHSNTVQIRISIRTWSNTSDQSIIRQKSKFYFFLFFELETNTSVSSQHAANHQISLSYLYSRCQFPYSNWTTLWLIVQPVVVEWIKHLSFQNAQS